MSPEAAAATALRHALVGRPRLGHARLICLDGPSGSGKTTVAAAIAAAAPHAVVLHVDEMFPGWDGMPLIPGVLDRLLRPIAHGRDGWWRRWDWDAGRWAEWRRVRPGGLIVLEGVGAGARGLEGWVNALVWVQASRQARLARGVARDDGLAEQWRRWQAREDALFVREHPRRRADLVVRTDR